MTQEDDCPKCGADESSITIIPFNPSLTKRQSEQDWAENIHELHGLVCTECGLVISLIDIRNSDDDIESGFDENHRKSISNEFKIDWELE